MRYINSYILLVPYSSWKSAASLGKPSLIFSSSYSASEEFYWDDTCPLTAASTTNEKSEPLRITSWPSADAHKPLQNKTAVVKDSGSMRRMFYL